MTENAPTQPVNRPTSEVEKAARKAIPYLSETGWIESRITQSSVDVAGKPIPWYSYAAIDFLKERVGVADRVFEFGSGNSTLWWAQRAKHVTGVEHDGKWATLVRKMMPENVELLEVPLEINGDYCRTPRRTEGRYEIVVIDGRDRVNCARQCLTALTDDGVVIWDDSHRRRYRPGLALLRDQGFRCLRFRGLGPISPGVSETSILYRAVNCLGI
jgi:hypothetical protein